MAVTNGKQLKAIGIKLGTGISALTIFMSYTICVGR